MKNKILSFILSLVLVSSLLISVSAADFQPMCTSGNDGTTNQCARWPWKWCIDVPDSCWPDQDMSNPELPNEEPDSDNNHDGETEVPGQEGNTPSNPETPNEPSVPEKDPSIPDEKPSIPDETPPTPNETPDENSGILPYELEVVKLVNQERAAYGLEPLSISSELCAGARLKSEDMQKNNYFSHTSPTYGTAFDLMKSLGISYHTAGENIAQGYTTPSAVVEAWMNSEGHRANILSSTYTSIGVGYVAEGNYWTQWFIS